MLFYVTLFNVDTCIREGGGAMRPDQEAAMGAYDIRETLVQAEWEDFRRVRNLGGAASCQSRPDLFRVMRMAQFLTWPEELVESYSLDLKTAKGSGRNIVAEKYAFMMESTDPMRYEDLRRSLPLVGEEARDIVGQVVAFELAWAEDYGRLYPLLSKGNRAMRTSEDTPTGTSFETYLRGELLTYSVRTLRLLLAHVTSLRSEGKNHVEEIMENEVRAFGYSSLSDAEHALADRQRR